MKVLYYLSVFFILSSTIVAQGTFVEKGKNGFTIGGGYLDNNEALGFGGHIGYTFSGILDLGFSVDQVNFNNPSDLSSTDFSPFIKLYLKPNFPLQLYLNAGYKYQKYNNDIMDDYGIDMNGNYYEVGVTMYSTVINIFEKVGIQPSFSFNMVGGDVKVYDSEYTLEVDDNNRTLYGLGISLVYDNTTNDNKIIFSGNVELDKKVTRYSSGISFVFSGN